MTTTTKENHALTKCVAQLETIKELYRDYKEAVNKDDDEAQEKTVEQAREEALSVDFRSGWSCSPDDLGDPEEFKILLSTGGPACQIRGSLNPYQHPEDIKIQYQDWGTFWEDLETSPHHDDEAALEWFCNCFYFGQ